MSDLLEKVARAIANEVDTVVGHKDGVAYHYKYARPAIRAVAEWLEAHEDFYANSQASKLRRQLGDKK